MTLPTAVYVDNIHELVEQQRESLNALNESFQTLIEVEQQEAKALRDLVELFQAVVDATAKAEEVSP